MKSIIKTVLAITIISLSSNLFAANNQIKLTVKALHNNNVRILEENSILFSGDSFQINVEAKFLLYVYAFLLDSSNNLQLLNSPNSASLINQNQTVSFPSSSDNWFQLDDKVGIETIAIVSSLTKLKTSKIKDLSKFDNIQKFKIRHFSSKIAMRGINNIDLIDEVNLDLSISISSSLSEKISPILESNPQSRTILKILKGSSDSEINSSSLTRGVKEVRIFEDSAPAVVFIETTSGHGTGALVSNDGLIFTNSHVVGNAKKVYVYFMPKNSGKYSEDDYMIGMVVNNNKHSDLALIKLINNPIGVKPLSLANASSLKIGQDVHAIGHPGNGSQWTYTKGYIGQILKNHEWSYDDGIDRKAQIVIQSQTPIMGGNSGGPLMNDAGEVIGVNSYGSDYAGANYAVSVKDLKLFLNEKFTITQLPAKTSEASTASYEWDANVIRVSKGDYDQDGMPDTIYFIDDDETGIWETVLIEIANTDDIVVIYDYDEDGNWNEKIVNTNSIPRPDFYMYDQDGDGEADVLGYDDDDDGVVDRYEKV